jgi:hypothetical protein
MIVAYLAAAIASAFDFSSFKTDAERDQWLKANSTTYAKIAEEIRARKDLHGYRFVSKGDVRRGMVLWSDGYLEVRLNKELSGADRITTLIFEVANGSRHRDHQQIDLAADKGLIRTAEEFGLAHEMVEYEALRMHRQVLLELESRAGPLPREFFYYVTPLPRSTAEYRLPDLFHYLKAQKETGHTAEYYKLFAERKSKR